MFLDFSSCNQLKRFGRLKHFRLRAFGIKVSFTKKTFRHTSMRKFDNHRHVFSPAEAFCWPKKKKFKLRSPNNKIRKKNCKKEKRKLSKFGFY
jgi:hypothetical protein